MNLRDLRIIRFYLTFLAKLNYTHETTLTLLTLKFEKRGGSISEINLKLGAKRFDLQSANQRL